MMEVVRPIKAQTPTSKGLKIKRWQGVARLVGLLRHPIPITKAGFGAFDVADMRCLCSEIDITARLDAACTSCLFLLYYSNAGDEKLESQYLFHFAVMVDKTYFLSINCTYESLIVGYDHLAEFKNTLVDAIGKFFLRLAGLLKLKA
ncbi:hypothetical protein Gogos_012299 [Gossypium gossypioides]|uniref:Uncharacterized protein n=1 Tax=Gossypium gossypioides TaxID=34282 RepID=A0A7J9BS35_GOSGO|nr:hypothetical protein [Gossypium gossypioides]